MNYLTFNGVRKPWLLLKKGRQKSPFASIDRQTIDVEGMDGSYLSGTRIRPLVIFQPVAFILGKNERSIDYEDELASWLFTKEPAPLEFSDEQGRTYFAVVQNTLYDFERFNSTREGTIEFLVLDGYGYGQEKTLHFPSDQVIVENNGTAEADPIFELTATKKSTFAMVSNGDDEYNLIGRPADVDEQIVDERTLIFDERGETLNNWITSGTSVDGTVSGTMTTDGTGIVVNNYGTGSTWHGPALIREIGPIQDFEIEMRLRVEVENPNMTYRIEFYLFDENMNVLGKMGLMDSSAARNQYSAEGRIGKFAGKDKNYLISSQNYQRNREHFHGLVRLRRVGKRFEFYVARIGVIDDFTHHDSLSRVFNDVNNEHQGRLKYVQIHIGKYGSTSNAPTPRINLIKVTELNQATVDQTPYILDVGDVVTFDHKNDDILVNGAVRPDLFTEMGADFFKLKEGYNNLVVTPANSFETKMRYQERFR